MDSVQIGKHVMDIDTYIVSEAETEWESDYMSPNP